MVRVDTPFASDDEFDVVNPMDTVSDMSDDEHPPKQQTARLQQNDSASRLSGPDQVPQMQAGSNYSDFQAVDSVAQKLPDSSIQDNHTSRSTHDATINNDKSGSNFGDGALKYTKSVYQKFWSGKDVLIAVMGMTGSGKTTFISKVTGRKDLEIGHNLTSCTRDIQVVETRIDGQVVRLVDTPGFSDTNLSDTEVLQMIADYLAAAYKQEMKLSGIIYLHPISDNRVTHHTTKNLEMFRKLTGERNLKNVVLATSMWDKVTPDQGSEREQELKSNFWKMLLAFGAKPVRHNGSPESARQIAQMLIANKPFYLQLQEEMGKDNKALRDTAAGREIMLEISRMKEEHERELAEMGSIIKNSAEESKTVIEALKEHYQGQLGRLERTLRDERKMNEEAMKSLTERIKALESRGGICGVM